MVNEADKIGLESGATVSIDNLDAKDVKRPGIALDLSKYVSPPKSNKQFGGDEPSPLLLPLKALQFSPPSPHLPASAPSSALPFLPPLELLTWPCPFARPYGVLA